MACAAGYDLGIPLQVPLSVNAEVSLVDLHSINLIEQPKYAALEIVATAAGASIHIVSPSDERDDRGAVSMPLYISATDSAFEVLFELKVTYC